MFKLLLLFVSINFVVCSDPIVQIPNGKIEGKIKRTERNNVTFYAFLGVPYAAPPVGTLRFKSPEPVKNWNGTLKASSKICYQVGLEHKDSGEDCLYLNIFTPVEPGTKERLPVMVNIHGGTFRRGCSYGGYTFPQFLIEQEVVVVTINYRLGPFGFLSSGDSVIPGNFGLKDQQFALKWVQRNIHLFGGDPKKVTLMGQSAGSASVTYQLLSPGSAGLFRAAIAQSSSALCTWANQRQAVEIAYGIAAEIDPSFTKNRTSQELLDFLMSVDGKAIHGTGQKYSAFSPVIEVEHEDAIITESMYEAAKNGAINKVPLITGICSEEALIMATNLNSWKKTCKNFDKDLRTLVDDDMNIQDDSVKLTVGKDIKMIYNINGSLADDLGASIQYFGDNRFMRPTIKFAELVSEYTDVYFYQFSYHGNLGGNKVSFDGTGKVGHGEDLYYLWAYHSSLKSFPESDIMTVDRYVKLFTNFAKTLNPTPESSELLQNVTWPKATVNKFYYLDIDENLGIKEDPRKFSYKKWVEIYDKYAKKPFVSF